MDRRTINNKDAPTGIPIPSSTPRKKVARKARSQRAASGRETRKVTTRFAGSNKDKTAVKTMAANEA
eukprot:scaffold113171_cov28-Tisochrysis_lutea.AAC.1